MATITTLGFDADDTLWHNETIFENTHKRYCELLSHYHNPDTIEEKLFATEMGNLELLGYGVKAHAISCIETAIKLSDGRVGAEEISAIIQLAKEMLEHPVELLEGAAESITTLARDRRLLLITKGDIRDQERKIRKSGLEQHFADIEILSEKNAATYKRILARHDIAPEEFLMVGNSLKSDILPVLDIGGMAVYVPYHITWQAERAEAPNGPEFEGRFFQIKNLHDLAGLLQRVDR
jgi:putative hydrolase of the HAD superfamily